MSGGTIDQEPGWEKDWRPRLEKTIEALNVRFSECMRLLTTAYQLCSQSMRVSHI